MIRRGGTRDCQPKLRRLRLRLKSARSGDMHSRHENQGGWESEQRREVKVLSSLSTSFVLGGGGRRGYIVMSSSPVVCFFKERNEDYISRNR